MAHDTEVMVNAGDAVFFPDAHGDTARNAGDDDVVLLLANLYTEGEPLLTLMITPVP